jgi:hypothetical protein
VVGSEQTLLEFRVKAEAGKTTTMVGRQRQWLEMYKHCWKSESTSWENNHKSWQTMIMVGGVSTIVGRVTAA